jgi:hypothetical protein
MKAEAIVLRQHKTYRLTPDYDQAQNLARSHHRYHHSLVCFSCCVSRHRQIYISNFVPHLTNDALFESSVSDTGYYIRCRFYLWFCVCILCIASSDVVRTREVSALSITASRLAILVGFVGGVK